MTNTKIPRITHTHLKRKQGVWFNKFNDKKPQLRLSSALGDFILQNRFLWPSHNLVTFLVPMWLDPMWSACDQYFIILLTVRHLSPDTRQSGLLATLSVRHNLLLLIYFGGTFYFEPIMPTWMYGLLWFSYNCLSNIKIPWENGGIFHPI